MITNRANGKRYVGQTTREVEKRFGEHSKANSYIGNAIRKHGVGCFSIEVIDFAKNAEELNEKEKYYIEKFETYGEGYNLTNGGDGVDRRIKIDKRLTPRQLKFLKWAKEQNAKELDVNDRVQMGTFCLINTIVCYLISEFKNEKRRAAEMILRLKPNYQDEIFRQKLFTKEEVISYCKG